MDKDFLNVFKLNLLEGRFYNYKDESKPLEQIVINKALAEALGFNQLNDAVGSIVPIFNRNVEIIGVIDNFHSQSPKHPIMPSFYTLGPGHKSYLSIKFDTRQKERAIKIAREAWREFFLDKPFEYFFMKNQISEQYLSDQRLMAALSYFAILAVFLAGLGLFGMSNLFVNQRRKELSIRRIFGANFMHLVFLLSKNILMLLLMSAVVVIPLAYIISNEWLSNYAFKIDLNPSYFILPIISIIVLSVSIIYTMILKTNKNDKLAQLH
ncbi:FtsX-like permease family protein [Fulvivirga aurantia]|uniref:FtsX-like permease family protein n=1 Tax=Fulvivirga aurantia TaxID=2529383 RepID=UPI0016249FA5